MTEGAPASSRPRPAFDRHELIPAIVQDARNGRVLMLGYMNEESFARTVDDREAWFWSRSRRRLWRKGETSGNVLRVRDVRLDCDGDTILVLADPAGPTCHTGATSCFSANAPELDASHEFVPHSRPPSPPELGGAGGASPGHAATTPDRKPLAAIPTGSATSDALFDVIRRRLTERPEGSYVAKLAAGGVERMAKKVGEEATEVVIAAMKGDRDELTREMADLWFHTYLVLAEAGLTPEDVWAELARRRRETGDRR